MENNLINIKPYAKPKKDGSGGASNITYNISGTDIGSDLNVKNLQANRIVTEYLEANNIQAGNFNTVNLVASDGTISSLRGDNLNYASGTIGDLNANNISTRNLTVDDTATIRNIFNNYLNSKEIVTDYLTVNKSAHFFEVVIDKIRSVGGTIINTATSCVLDFVEPVEENGTITKYRCYWKQTNDDGDYVSNDWLEGDQAISQNCNLVAGINHDTGNHYYWRLVVGKQAETENAPRAYVNFTTGEVKQVYPVDGKYDTPKYEIVFVGTYEDEEHVVHQVSGFHYNNGEDEYIGEGANRRQNPYYDFTDWTYVCETGQEDWDGTEKKLTVQDTLHGLELLPNKRVDNVTGIQGGVEYDAYISAGTLEFCTDYPTRLNTIIFFDDETIEFHAAPEKGQETTHYVIDIEAVTNAVVRKIVILSDDVDIWHACHWIELGNGQGEVDVPEVHDDLDPNDPRYSDELFGDEVEDWDNVPARGDNIAQLGYRYGANPDADAKSRASAIIIAAYKTPDSGGIDGDKVIMPVYPPSYAQYQDITDFQLFTHRGTYMDRTGGYFKGKLISEGGTVIDIDDELTVDTEYYQLICNENPITRPSSGTKNITFRILYVYNGIGTILSSLPTNWYTKTSLDNYTDEDDLTITINSNTQSLEVRLYNENNNLKDTYVATTINLDDITDGDDGAYNQWAYRNWASGVTGPAAPTSNSTYPPTDWSATPQTITDVLPYTWMTTRTVTPSDNNPYGLWSNPIRITGDNGRAGEDGDFTEFIYTRNDTGIVPSAPPHGTYARDWPNDGTTDHQTVNGVTWYDNPQGVESDMKYEYVSSRQYNGTTQTWTDYCTPALWAKWGENGMDGDGIKYIFTMAAGGVLNAPKFSPNGWNDVWSNRFDSNNGTVNNRHMWYDDAFNPTDEKIIDQDGNTWSNSNVLCSISKTYTKDSNNVIWWTNWSTPKIWAMYVEDGTSGPTGPVGPQGDDGQEDTINLLRGIFEVRINPHSYSTTTAYENITGDLYTDIIVAVKHTEGTESRYLTYNELDTDNYSLEINTDNTSGTTIFTSDTIVKVKQNGTDGTTQENYYDGIRFDSSNLLVDIGASPSDYFNLHKNNRTSWMPTKLFIKLLKGIEIVDTITIDLIFKPDHVFSVGETQLNSIYQGLSGLTGVSWTTGFSQIHQDWQNINLSVNNIKKTSALQYPEDNKTQKYAWLVDVKTSNPSAPTDPITYNTPAEHGYWTTSSDTAYLSSTYNGHFMSNKTRNSYFGNDGTLQYTDWTNWSKPTLYATYEDGVGTTVNSAQLDIKADQITSTVSATYLRKDATGVYVSQSQLVQTATGIYAGVTSDIEGKLSETGIDIQGTNRTIELTADNVVFASSDGTQTGKISIDATTGTLHTVNADISGDITAGIYKSLTYEDTSTLTGLSNGLSLYNSNTDTFNYSYSNFIFSGYWAKSNYYHRYIILPPANKVEGMELNIYRIAQNDQYGQLRVQIQSSDYVVLPSNGSGVFSPNFIEMNTKRLYAYSYNDIIYDGIVEHQDSTYTAFYVLAPGRNLANYATNYMIENVDTSNTKFAGNRSVEILNNNLATFKAMNGTWYLTRGITTASS